MRARLNAKVLKFKIQKKKFPKSIMATKKSIMAVGKNEILKKKYKSAQYIPLHAQYLDKLGQNYS